MMIIMCNRIFPCVCGLSEFNKCKLMFMLCIISKGEDTKSDPDHDRIISNLI